MRGTSVRARGVSLRGRHAPPSSSRLSLRSRRDTLPGLLRTFAAPDDCLFTGSLAPAGWPTSGGAAASDAGGAGMPALVIVLCSPWKDICQLAGQSDGGRVVT